MRSWCHYGCPRKDVEVSSAAVHIGAPSVRICTVEEKVAATVVDQKAGKTFPATVNAGLSAEKIYERGKAPQAALVRLLLFITGKLPTEVCKNTATPVAALWAGKTPPAAAEARAPPVEVCMKLEAPLWAGKALPAAVETGSPSVEVCKKLVSPLAGL